MKIRIDITAIPASFIVLFCNAGLMGFLKGSMLVTLAAYGAVLLWLLIAFVNDRVLQQRFLSISLPIIIFMMFLMIVTFTGSGDLRLSARNMTKNIMFLLLFFAMFLCYSQPEREAGRKLILASWFADIVVSCCYTLYRLEENPMLSRYLAVGTVQNYLDASVSTAGVLGFGSIYGLVLVFAALYWCIKNTKSKQKLCMVLCAVLFFYTVVQAQFFIAFVIALLSVLLNAVWEKDDRHKRFSRLLIAVLFVVLAGVIIARLLPRIISSGVLPDMIARRLKMFSVGSSASEKLSASRKAMYLKTLMAIRNTYGLGIVFVGKHTAGGHSEIMDLFANYGIVFAVLFLHGMWKLQRAVLQAIPENAQRNYNIVWLSFIIISILNPSLWCPTTVCLLLTIPLLYIALQPMHCEGETA